MTFASERAVKAVRKPHRCDGCHTRIDVGSPAMRWAGMTDGDFGSLIYHLECRAAEIDYNDNILGHMCGDEWQVLAAIDRDDWAWLIEAHPLVARRVLGNADPRTASGEAAAPPPDAATAPGGT